MIRPYFEVSKLTFRLQLTYRSATIASLVTTLFFGLLRAYVLVALFGEQETVAGISLQGAITYSGLVQGLIAYLAIFGWYDLMNAVDSGEISTDLLRPTAFFNYFDNVTLGTRLKKGKYDRLYDKFKKSRLLM